MAISPEFRPAYGHLSFFIEKHLQDNIFLLTFAERDP